MRKRWKVFWIVCAVFAVTGLFLMGAGAVMGGFSALRDREDRWIADFWEDDMMGYAGSGSASSDGESSEELPEIEGSSGASGDGYVPGEENGDTVISYDTPQNLQVDLGGMAARVSLYDGGRILVDTRYVRSDLRDQLHVEEDGDELQIEMEHHQYRNTNDVGMLYISIPAGTAFEEVSVELGAGAVEMDGISGKEISADVGAGQIVLSGFSAEKLEADCRAGQIILQGEVTDEADLNCSVGEIRYTAAGGIDTYNYEVSSSAGEVVIGPETYGGLGKNMKIDNGSECLLKTECRAGRVEIMFE